MRIVDEHIALAELKELARAGFGDMVKAVVDIDRGLMAIGGELHADGEALLLESGSRQERLWGINIYPELEGDDRVAFDSLINVRPAQGNKTRSIEDPGIRKRVLEIVEGLIVP